MGSYERIAGLVNRELRLLEVHTPPDEWSVVGGPYLTVWVPMSTGGTYIVKGPEYAAALLRCANEAVRLDAELERVRKLLEIVATKDFETGEVAFGEYVDEEYVVPDAVPPIAARHAALCAVLWGELTMWKSAVGNSVPGTFWYGWDQEFIANHIKKLEAAIQAAGLKP